MSYIGAFAILFLFIGVPVLLAVQTMRQKAREERRQKQLIHAILEEMQNR